MVEIIRNISPIRMAALASGLLFFVLLGIRMALFAPAPETAPIPVSAIRAKETWMSILQQNKKIGYSHRRMTPADDGFQLADTTMMRLNTMGMVQDVHMQTTAKLGPDFKLTEFDFSLKASRFDFFAHGEVKNDELIVQIGDKTAHLPMEDGLYLSAGVLDAANGREMALGETRSYHVFDPTTLGRRAVRITAVSDETVALRSGEFSARKLSVNFMGASQTAWIGEDGAVLKESGPMGISLEKTTQQEAVSGLTLSPDQDLTRLVSVEANRTIPEPDQLESIRLNIGGIDTYLSLDGGRQRLNGSMLHIVRENTAAASTEKASNPQRYLNATPFIEADHPSIMRLAGQLVSAGDSPRTKLEKLTAWVYENIEKRPVLSVPSALQTLTNRSGDCNEHAVLLAALARAAGLPARIEAGLVYMRGRFYYHAWNVVYLDQWVTVDALMNQIPADVTHIRFVRGEPESQVDLMSVIGSVTLEIVEMQKRNDNT